MAVTNKNDWMAELLSDNGYFVSGHRSFSDFLGVAEDVFCTLRFIHKDRFLKILLLTEAASLSEFNFKFNGDALGEVFAFFGSELIMIVFDKDGFSISTDRAETFSPKTSKELEDFFSDMDAEITKNKGTFKAINRSTNDRFQTWTRNHLTKYCTVNDIDAIRISDSSIILELKRVEESLETWRPYLDDYRNYMSFHFIARKFQLRARTIAYSPQVKEAVAMHVMLSPDPSRKYIDGRYIILSPLQAIAAEIPEETRARLETYRSTNRRVH